MMRLCLLLLCFLTIVPVKGQKKIYRTEVFDPLIQTLQVRVENAPLYPPIISLQSDDRIIVPVFTFEGDVAQGLARFAGRVEGLRAV